LDRNDGPGARQHTATYGNHTLAWDPKALPILLKRTPYGVPIKALDKIPSEPKKLAAKAAAAHHT
jgi:hypothetical protein